MTAGRHSHATTLAAVEIALTKTGVEFAAENGGGSGVRLKRKAKR